MSITFNRHTSNPYSFILNLLASLRRDLLQQNNFKKVTALFKVILLLFVGQTTYFLFDVTENKLFDYTAYFYLAL